MGYRLVAIAIVVASMLRLLWHGAVDLTPMVGFEAADLQRSMFYHYGLKGYTGTTFGAELAASDFKPPLWYAGIPLLAAWRDSLDVSTFLTVNAAALGLTALAVWLLTRRLGGPGAALLAVGILCVLPGVSGRLTFVGVEASHLAVLTWSVLLLFHLRDGPPSSRRAIPLGLLVGGGLLMKWNLGLYLLPVLLWELARVDAAGDARRARFRQLGLAAMIALGALSLWLPWADVSVVLHAGALGEVSFESEGLAAAMLYYPQSLVLLGLGLWSLPAVLLAGVGVAVSTDLGRKPQQSSLDVAPTHASRSWGEVQVLVLVLFSLLLVHLLIPHKEFRYLIPGFGLVSVLLGVGLGALAARGWAARVAVIASVGLMGWGTFATASEEAAVARSGDIYRPEQLRFLPSTDDYGLGELVGDPSLMRHRPAVVTYVVQGENPTLQLTSLHWAFYGRNTFPVVSRTNHPDVLSPSAAFDLARSTHLVTDQELHAEHRAALASLGYRLVRRAAPRVEGLSAVNLWERTPPEATAETTGGSQ